MEENFFILTTNRLQNFERIHANTMKRYTVNLRDKFWPLSQE